MNKQKNTSGWNKHRHRFILFNRERTKKTRRAETEESQSGEGEIGVVGINSICYFTIQIGFDEDSTVFSANDTILFHFHCLYFFFVSLAVVVVIVCSRNQNFNWIRMYTVKNHLIFVLMKLYWSAFSYCIQINDYRGIFKPTKYHSQKQRHIFFDIFPF